MSCDNFSHCIEAWFSSVFRLCIHFLQKTFKTIMFYITHFIIFHQWNLVLFRYYRSMLSVCWYTFKQRTLSKYQIMLSLVKSGLDLIALLTLLVRLYMERFLTTRYEILLCVSCQTSSYSLWICVLAFSCIEKNCFESQHMAEFN